MFGRNKKDKLKELSDRLTKNSKAIEDDHHDLQELTVLVKALKTSNEALIEKVAELESRQHTLREGIKDLVTLEEPSTPDFINNPPETNA